MKIGHTARTAREIILLAAVYLGMFFLLVPAHQCLAQEQAESSRRSNRGQEQQTIQQRRELERLEMELQRQRQIAEEQRSQAEMQLKRTRMQIEAMAQQMAGQAQVAQEEHVEYRVYSLKYLPALEAVESISRVLERGPHSTRLSADPRANSLIAAGSPEQLETIGALLQNLDVARAAVSPVESAAAETIQLRMIWLLDGLPADEDASTTKGLDGRVLSALAELGFEHPSIVCQPVASMVVGDDMKGRFQVEVPVIVGGSLFTFQSSGDVRTASDGRYAVQWNARVMQKGVDGNANAIVGSVLTPLGHYTVLGTNMIVSIPTAPDQELTQHPSAFVIQLTQSNGESAKPAGEDSQR